MVSAGAPSPRYSALEPKEDALYISWTKQFKGRSTRTESRARSLSGGERYLAARRVAENERYQIIEQNSVDWKTLVMQKRNSENVFIRGKKMMWKVLQELGRFNVVIFCEPSSDVGALTVEVRYKIQTRLSSVYTCNRMIRAAFVQVKHKSVIFLEPISSAQ